MKKRQEKSPKAPPGANRSAVPVVGIGASAGGLKALKELLGSIPDDSQAAYVVILHLSPDYESHLAELLQPNSSMPIVQATEETSLEANHVYVIPPGYYLRTVDTVLQLFQFSDKEHKRSPIDHFFQTLAEAHGDRAVAIILTGSGSDGTLGLKYIKEKGGLTIVQDPSEAEFDGMPQSAIISGMVDLVLKLEEIPQGFLRFIETEPRISFPANDQDLMDDQGKVLQQIFSLLRARLQHDFAGYKISTILRRIKRRMQVHSVLDLSEYLHILKTEPNETSALGEDLLITVTRFFRDQEVFEELENTIIPAIVSDRDPDDEIRVWSIGCATGEEAYSLAILLAEQTRLTESSPRIQIFASDIHDGSLDRARKGFYSGAIEADVSEKRLSRFFIKESSGYRLRKEIREMILFTPHNMLSDPPFSRLDLICCRNVLIYLKRPIQKKVVDMFHYALRPDGYLLLGTSENIEGNHAFRALSKKHSLYRRRNVPRPDPHLSVFPSSLAPISRESKPQKRHLLHTDYATLHEQMLERHAPPSMLLNGDDHIVHLSENAGRYLVHPRGTITSSAFLLIRKELRLELRSAIQTSKKEKKTVSTPPLSLTIDGDKQAVVLHVHYAGSAGEENEEGHVLVIFEDRPLKEKAGSAGHANAPDEATARLKERIRELENESTQFQDRLRSIIEDYETGQEEMKASHEELQSTNEELRSAMEELETSKEELQSMNEELQTVNQENRLKVEELSQLYSDMQNLLAATDIATIFLDRSMCILRFTPRMENLFNIRETDRGRPISDLTHRLGYKDLTSDAESVLRNLTPVEREVRDADNHWYLVRVLPYRTSEDLIEGVVATFIDITSRKGIEEDLIRSKNYSEDIFQTLQEPILVLDKEVHVQRSNQAFLDHFQVAPEQIHDVSLFRLGQGQWDIPELRELLQSVISEGKVFQDFEVTHTFDSIGRRTMLLNARFIQHSREVLLGIRDITSRKNAERDLREANERLEERVEERTRQVRELVSRLTMTEHRERQRLSHVLHDDLQQLLYSIDMRMHIAYEGLSEEEKEKVSKAFEESRRWLEEAVKLTRKLTVDLSPPILKNEGLKTAVLWLKRQMSELCQLEVRVEGDEVCIEEQEIRILLFQIIRELLFNVFKHAETSTALVRLEARETQVIVHIEDDGKGFDVKQWKKQRNGNGGFGLNDAADRLRLIGGDLTIQSSSGKGTRIEMVSPIQVHSGESGDS